MSFQQDFNGLLNQILTDYRNRFESEITEGSVLFIRAACTASMLWGLYRMLDKVSDQMFVETADRAYKERHAAEFSIVTAGKTDAQIVDEVLAAKRSKMSGGNRYDYIAWAREVTLDNEYITYAMVVPLARGEGTFDIVVVGSDNQGRASTEICARINDLIQERRPIGAGFSWGVRICYSIPTNIEVKISGTGANWNQIATRDAIRAYINELLPGEILYVSQILSIMHQYGAERARVLEPAHDMAPPEPDTNGNHHMFRVSNVIIEPWE